MKDDYLVLKIAGGVVLGLLIWNAFERYQQRKALEAGVAELARISADPDPLGWNAAIQSQKRKEQVRRAASAPKPVPPGFRCMDGALLKRIDNGWIQITSRHNEWYCPPGGSVQDCFQVTEKSVGCR
jgi:hypothetical protein